jgi:hypothetical protein
LITGTLIYAGICWPSYMLHEVHAPMRDLHMYPDHCPHIQAHVISRAARTLSKLHPQLFRASLLFLVHPCSKPSKPVSEWDTVEQTPHIASKWDATPGPAALDASRWDATPGIGSGAGETPAWGTSGRWDSTPAAEGLAGPTPKRNRWDDATPGRVCILTIFGIDSCNHAHGTILFSCVGLTKTSEKICVCSGVHS